MPDFIFIFLSFLFYFFSLFYSFTFFLLDSFILSFFRFYHLEFTRDERGVGCNPTLLFV